MKRIAVVFNGDLSINRQGQLNSAICRIKYLSQLEKFQVDAYCIQEYSVGLLRWFRGEKRPKKQPIAVADGISINVIYKPCFFISVLFETRFKIDSVITRVLYWFISKRFKDYDMISGHSIIGGRVGHVVNNSFGVPYCVTWHGSDIHTLPLLNRLTKRQVSSIEAKASCNIFVSQSLLEDARKLFVNIPNPHVAYNAPSEAFVKYNDRERAELREKENVFGKKVVAFVGNLVPVKNVFTLPRIFERVKEEYKNVVFWIIGHGMHSETLKQKMIEAGVECRFWGNRQPEEMPRIMNCIDVLVLPSKNESFGMVLVEAIACGANAVGSNRGGIPEVIGMENCFDLDESFENKIAERIVYMLKNHIEQGVKPIFDWHQTAKNECLWYSEILSSCEDRE